MIPGESSTLIKNLFVFLIYVDINVFLDILSSIDKCVQFKLCS